MHWSSAHENFISNFVTLVVIYQLYICEFHGYNYFIGWSFQSQGRPRLARFVSSCITAHAQPLQVIFKSQALPRTEMFSPKHVTFTENGLRRQERGFKCLSIMSFSYPWRSSFLKTNIKTLAVLNILLGENVMCICVVLYIYLMRSLTNLSFLK